MLSGLDLTGLASDTVEIEGYLGCKKKKLRKNKRTRRNIRCLGTSGMVLVPSKLRVQ